jgi:hypothetical protein
MEVIPWLKTYVVMWIIVFTIITVNVKLKKLQYVIVNVIMQKKLKRLRVKLSDVNRNLCSYLFLCELDVNL